MPPCAPGAIATCWARLRPAPPRRRCASDGGRCWPSPSTRRGVRATRCAASDRPGACWSAEFGLEPGPDLVALEQAILRQDPSLAAAVALPEASATCPYRGLLRYDVGDADTYYGRDDDVRPAWSGWPASGRWRWSGRQVAASRRWCEQGSPRRSNVGDARSGCSRREPTRRNRSPRWASFPPAPSLVVDQCEEAFTLCDDAAERTRVPRRADRARGTRAAGGSAACRPARRSRCSSRVCPARRAKPAPAGRDGRRRTARAIEAPARQYGLLLEAGLVDVLVGEVEGEPGALPLLSHALRETWVRRQGRTLTVEGYRESGGIRSAVAQSAERVYDQLDQVQRPLLRDLMLRLVTPTPDGDPVRGQDRPPCRRYRRRARAPDRDAGRRSPRDQRRAHGRTGPRVTRAGLAPAARLAR